MDEGTYPRKDTKALKKEYEVLKEKLEERQKQLAELDSRIEQFDSHKTTLTLFTKHITSNNERVTEGSEILKRWLRRRTFRHFNSEAIRTYLSEKEVSQARMRYKVLEEITETEKTYVKGLNQIITPLQMKVGFAKEWERLEFIFDDIVIIRDLAEILLSLLEERLGLWPSVQSFGDIFLEQVPLMKLYHRYIRNYNMAQHILEKCRLKKAKFNEFCNARVAQLGLEITSFLVMPVQRLPRYKLLVSSLLGRTSVTHVDYENLRHALNEIEKVSLYIEKSQTELEEMLDCEKMLKCISRGKLVGNKKTVSGDVLMVEIGQLKIAASEKFYTSAFMKESYETQAMREENPVFKEKPLDADGPQKIVLKVQTEKQKLKRHDIATIEIDIPTKSTKGWLPMTISDYVKGKAKINCSSIQLHVALTRYVLKEVKALDTKRLMRGDDMRRMMTAEMKDAHSLLDGVLIDGGMLSKKGSLKSPFTQFSSKTFNK